MTDLTRTTPHRDIAWRCVPTAADQSAVRDIVASTGMFSRSEVGVAEELVRERLERGEESGYFFVFAECDGRLLGYSCYGPIACTEGSYDLFWIAVRPDWQGQGLGRRLLEEAERLIRSAAGRQVYIETSNRAQYGPTRGFYLRCGYQPAAVLADFYAPGDDKVVYVKQLVAAARGG